jgi:hypothetical protein
MDMSCVENNSFSEYLYHMKPSFTSSNFQGEISFREK